MVDRAGFEPAAFRSVGLVVLLANRTFFGLTLSVYQAELPAHGSRGFSVCLLSLVCGAAAGTFTPCWGGLNPASRLHWPRLSCAFQACTLPSYVTAATTAALWLSGICKFPTWPDDEELVGTCVGPRFFGSVWARLLHRSIHFY